MNLIAIVDETAETIETMWGDPNRWADRQRHIFQVSLTLSNRDQRAGYTLQRLDLYGESVMIGQGHLEPKGTQSLGLVPGTLIEISGPLYRADTFAFAAHELTEEERPAFAIPFQGHSVPKTIEVEVYEGGRKVDRRRHLPPLSLKTTQHAVGYLPEQPFSLLTGETQDPLGQAILETLAREGPDAVRAAYFPGPEAARQPQQPPVVYERRQPPGHEIDADPYFTLMADPDGVGFVHCGDGVLVVPLTADGEVLLAVERSAAFAEEALGLVAGAVEPGEPLEETANRELQEELGWRAERIDFLGELRPFKYLTTRQFAFLARDLSPSRLEGDEQYPVHVRAVPLDAFPDLVAAGELHDALAIAALSLAHDFLRKEAT
jgi:ADP-ribose diphosphatase